MSVQCRILRIRDTKQPKVDGGQSLGGTSVGDKSMQWGHEGSGEK